MAITASDDYGNDINTSSALAIGSQLLGNIEQKGDQDWFKVSLEANTVYNFIMAGENTGEDSAGLAQASLQLFDAQGAPVLFIDNSMYGVASLSYLAPSAGTYYLKASALQDGAGMYRLASLGQDLPWDEAVSSPIYQIDSELHGRLSAPKQHDYYAFELQAGKTYVFDLLGSGSGKGTLGAGAGEARLALMTDYGSGSVASTGSGVGGDPRVQFTPTESKTYFVQVSDAMYGGGSYTLKSWTPGNPGNDSLYDTPAADIIDAGAGIDTMIYAGKHADYTVARSGDTVSVSAKSGGATDMLTSFERIQFADETVLFDGAGAAAQAYRLYEAAFGRVADSAGLGYWIKVMENGASLKEVAASFAASDEFKQLYGDHPSNAVLTTRFYDNVLHRPADQAGHDYWLGVLDGGATVGDVLASFSESPENQAALATVIGNGFAYTPYGA